MINTQAAARQQPKKKSKSGKLGGGENLLKEIQAMIISQDITRKNRAKMAKVGGQHALRFLNDPKLNEHKIIGEKFQRRKFQSLAVDLYKSKLSNNPMRNEIKLLPLSPSGGGENDHLPPNHLHPAVDKENMPNVAPALDSAQQQALEMDYLTLPRMSKAERNALGVAVDPVSKINKTFDDTVTNLSSYLVPSAIHAKQSYNT